MRHPHEMDNPPGVAAPDGLSKVELGEITREILLILCTGKAEREPLYAVGRHSDRIRAAAHELIRRMREGLR